MVVAATCAAFVACGSDDDDDASVSGGNNLVTPQYESVSALYQITDDESDIQSIELTASGNYIITTAPSYNAKTRGETAAHKAHFFSWSRQTRAAGYYGDIIYGKYTQLSDTEFLLENWGTITVTGSSDNAKAITITPVNGTTYTLTATKQTQYPDSDLTNKICRTWSISTFRCVLMMNNTKKFDKEYKVTEVRNWVADMQTLSRQYYADDYDDEDELDDWDDEEDLELPQQIVFSKAGTYMVYYNKERLAVSTWAWVNESKGQMRYSWNYNDMYDDSAAGVVSIAFRDNQLAVTEIIDEEDDDYDEDELSYYIYFTWYMDEVK